MHSHSPFLTNFAQCRLLFINEKDLIKLAKTEPQILHVDLHGLQRQTVLDPINSFVISKFSVQNLLFSNL